ncbi:hypothetical protein GO613_12765 [Azoarcus communis]|uniref:hypothetical protein n=1 Tax=Parazoarcus communis TaxID=41977 RepID=UPI0014594D7C|nr:hypothetical protein [Parazoarcus communis]NMG48973.1 hypothetical protein [Parazoarcus communis]
MTPLSTTGACSASTSRCPNARVCSLWDQYGPDCEAGAVMQKCFVAIHQELGVLQALARDRDTPSPGRPVLRLVRDTTALQS